MAYRVHTSNIGTDGTTTSSFDLTDAWPETQQDGDMFIVVACNDGGNTALGGMSEWTQIHLDGSAISGQRSGAWYRIRSGSDVPAPTLTGANDEWAVGVMVYRDVDTTTPLDVAAGVTQQTSNTQTPQCPTITTTTANSTILRVVTRDSVSCPRPLALLGQGAHVLTRTDSSASSTATCALTVWESVKPTAGDVGTADFIDISNDGGVQMTIALRNASGGKVPAYPTTTPIETLLPLNTAPTATALSELHPSPETLLGRVCALTDTTGGVVRNTAQAAASVANNMLLGYYAFIRTFGQAQTATTGLAGTYGAAYTLTATSDLSNALFVASWAGASQLLSNTVDNVGQAIYFRDTAGAWALWRPMTEAQNLRARSCCVHLPSETMVETGGGTINWAQIERIGVAVPISGTSGTTANRELQFYCLGRIPLTGGAANPLAICGGSAAKPLDSRDVSLVTSVPYLTDLISVQGAKQNLISFSVQIGDGTNPAFYDGAAGSIEFYQPASLPAAVRIPQDYAQYRIKAAAGDSIRFGAQSVGSLRRQRLIIDPASSSSATHGFVGTVFNMAVTLDSDIPVSNATFTGCSEIDAQGATLTGVSIEASTSTDAAIAFTANGGIVESTIDVTGTSCAFHIELGASVTTLDLTDTTLSGTPGTSNINVLRTTGTVTITLATGQTQPSYTTAGATVVYDQPTVSVLVTSSESESLIQLFVAGTQTVLASTTGTSVNYVHSGETVDIVVQKAGYLPQRIANIVLSGNMSQAFMLVPDFNYNPSHGLVYGDLNDATWDRATNRLAVNNWGPSIRNIYSLMIDSFITETSLRNTPFNLSMNGTNSLFFINGAEGVNDTSITNMTGGGVRYLDSSGNTVAEFVGVVSSGVVAGSQPEYELGAAAAVVDTRATGNVNEIIKTYKTGSGAFDKRDHLQFKVQRNGYRQTEVDVLESYGISTLEPTLYVVSLNMIEITGLTLGDPLISGVTITKHVSPVVWNAGDGNKNYSITIEDSGTNSGEDILRWLNYNLSLDAPFQGLEPFYWPEMVLDNGPAYETVRGKYHGNPDVIVGVRVIRTGGTPHPDFTRFQSDDGSYGTPPVLASALISNIVAGSKVRIFDETANSQVYLGTPGTSYSLSYSDGTTYTDGNVLRITIHKKGYLTYQTSLVVGASGWSVTADQVVDDVYVALGIDGSTVTGFAADYINSEVNVTVASDFNLADMYAWWNANLETDSGITNFVGGITALDIANFRINNAIVDIYIDNTTATNLKQLDNRRIFRSDGAYPVKSSGGGGIDVVWRNTILIAETGVSGLTPSEASTLAKIDTLTENVGGLRFTTKALEQAPSGGGSLTAEQVRIEIDNNSTKLNSIQNGVNTVTALVA